MLMRCLVGHSRSPGIEKAPYLGACGFAASALEIVCLRRLDDFGVLLRSSENKLQNQYITTISSSQANKLKVLKSRVNCSILVICAVQKSQVDLLCSATYFCYGDQVRLSGRKRRMSWSRISTKCSSSDTRMPMRR